MVQHYPFPKSHRLAGRGFFSRVFDQRVKESRGPIAIFSAPNELGFSRLGLSIGRSAGTAPRRNRIKRLLRESFRLMQHDLPPGRGYDLVIVVRPHTPMILAEYQKALSSLITRLHRQWQERTKS